MDLSLSSLESHFNENFVARSELGASVSIWQGETEVISLNGGKTHRNSETNDWTSDTLVPIWSATKGPAALTVLLALADANLSLQDPVKKIWPELRAGSSDLSFAQLLAHQSGLAGMSADNRSNILQHSEVAKALEQQQPFWQPGEAHGYHARTSGALLDEIVRRISGGKTLGRLWFEKIAKPLGIDLFIGGLNDSEQDRLATIYPPKHIKPPEDQKAMYKALLDPESLSFAAFASPSGMKSMSDINKPEFLQSGVPSFGGVASAKGLAKFYAILANRGFWQGSQVFPETMVDIMSHPISQGHDLTLLIPTAFSCGFMLDPVESGRKVRQVFGSSTRAFGQPGAGGSHAFADPDNGLAFAYVMNQMESGILPNDKSLGFVKLVYSS